MNRLEQLKEFAKEDPQDPFTLYALALEYLKSNIQEARSAFESLLTTHPDYLPTYYPAAHLMIDLGEASKAEQLFLQGMDVAKSQNEMKAYRELQSAYQTWKLEAG